MNYHKTFLMSAFFIMSMISRDMNGSEGRIVIENKCSLPIIIELIQQSIFIMKIPSIIPIEINAQDRRETDSFRKMIVKIKSSESPEFFLQTENLYLSEGKGWLTIEDGSDGYIKINSTEFPLALVAQ